MRPPIFATARKLLGINMKPSTFALLPRLPSYILGTKIASMERKLVNERGTCITIRYVEKWGDFLMSTIYKDGGMHLMFIKDIEAEVEMLKGEGYVEVASDNE